MEPSSRRISGSLRSCAKPISLSFASREERCTTATSRSLRSLRARKAGSGGRSAVTAMSIEKSSSLFNSCAELPVTSRTDSFGCFSRKRASSGRM